MEREGEAGGSIVTGLVSSHCRVGGECLQSRPVRSVRRTRPETPPEGFHPAPRPASDPDANPWADVLSPSDLKSSPSASRLRQPLSRNHWIALYCAGGVVLLGGLVALAVLLMSDSGAKEPSKEPSGAVQKPQTWQYVQRATRTDTILATLRANVARIAHVHTAGVPGRHELDGQQELQYPAVMRALAEAGYRGWVAHEFVPTRGHLEGLRQAVAACTT